MAVKGVFASDQGIVGNRVGDFASALLMINPTGSAPMLALSSGMPTEDAKDTIVNWFEENHIAGNFTIASFVTDGDGTGIVIGDASSLIAGTVLFNEDTGEYVLVDSISGNTLTVTRGIGSTSASTMSAAETLQRVGTGHEEGSAMPVAVVNQGDVRFNVTQIFRNSWGLTGTVRAIQFHTGNQEAKNKADCSFFHAEDIERSLMWGNKHVGTLNNQPLRLMDGIVTQGTNHGAQSTSQSTNTQWADLVAHYQNVFAKNIKGKPNERIAFCGNEVLRVISEIAALDGTQNISPGQTEFGLKVTKLLTPFGDVSLMTHPLMNENATWSKNLYSFHPGGIKTRWLRKTFIDAFDSNGNRIAGVDSNQGVYTSELSVQNMAAETTGIYTGIDTAAAA